MPLKEWLLMMLDDRVEADEIFFVVLRDMFVSYRKFQI